jgi:hypothetical protein
MCTTTYFTNDCTGTKQKQTAGLTFKAERCGCRRSTLGPVGDHTSRSPDYMVINGAATPSSSTSSPSTASYPLTWLGPTLARLYVAYCPAHRLRNVARCQHPGRRLQRDPHVQNTLAPSSRFSLSGALTPSFAAFSRKVRSRKLDPHHGRARGARYRFLVLYARRRRLAGRDARFRCSTVTLRGTSLLVLRGVSEHQPPAWNSAMDIHVMVLFMPVGLIFCFRPLTDPLSRALWSDCGLLRG